MAEAFHRLAERYDRWFETHRPLFLSELRLVRALFPGSGPGLEVGVGTGRFAEAVGIRLGLEPSPAMARLAQKRGIAVVRGRGEDLPFHDASFARVLIVVTICFAEDPHRMLAEAWRVLAPGGALGVGLIDRESAWGHHYLTRKTQDPFYREANFFAAREVESMLKALAPRRLEVGQTLRTPPPGAFEPEWPRPGYGEGGFVFFALEKP